MSEDAAKAEAVEAAALALVNAERVSFDLEPRADLSGAARADKALAHARTAIDAYLSRMAEAGWVMVERKLLVETHACMRETGWQLAWGAQTHGSDGVLEAACSDVEGRFAAMLKGSK